MSDKYTNVYDEKIRRAEMRALDPTYRAPNGTVPKTTAQARAKGLDDVISAVKGVFKPAAKPAKKK